MKRIILTAGHNGKGTGANGYIDEGAETIVLRDSIADWLKVKYPQIEIITDKERDNQKLANIVAWIKGIFRKDDICVDIHFNSSTSEMATGCEAFVPTKYSGEEMEIAQYLASCIAKTLGIKNRGVNAFVEVGIMGGKNNNN